MVRKNNRGFTIIELMIAITILSVTILLFTYGAIQVSRSYQKASIRITLLNTTRELHSDFTQNLQFSGLNVVTTHTDGTNTFEVTCLGGKRYIRYNTAVQTSANYGLLYSEDITGAVSCASPVVIGNAKLTLPAGTKATRFSLTGTNIYTLDSRFVTGEKDMFESSNFNNSCISVVRGGQFCAAVQLVSTVTRKVR